MPRSFGSYPQATGRVHPAGDRDGDDTGSHDRQQYAAQHRAKQQRVDHDPGLLAAAGLERLGRLEDATELLSLDGWPTAPGQGALALEVRVGDEKLVSALEHRPTRTMVDAERAVLAILEAGCAAPIAARAFTDDGMLFLDARVYSTDGSQRLTSSHALYLDDTPSPAADVAGRVAAELIALGASSLGVGL